MNITASPQDDFRAAQLAVGEIISELFSSTRSDQIPILLAERIREFIGCRTVLITTSALDSDSHPEIFISPIRRSSQFEPAIDIFSSLLQENELCSLTKNLDQNYPLHTFLTSINVDSIVTIPLKSDINLITLICLDLPESGRIDEVPRTLKLFAPVIAMSLSNFIAYRKIEQQAQQLEQRIAERTQELELANRKHKNLAAGLSSLIESTSDFIWSVDTDWQIVTYNSALADHLYRSYGKRIFVGAVPHQLLPENRVSIWPELYARAVEEAFSTELKLGDGRTLDLTLSPIISEGVVSGVSVFGKDISVRIETESKLKESEERYHRSIELTGLIGWSSRADGQIEDMPVWRKFTGQTVEAVRGWGWLDAIHPDDREHAAHDWQKAVDTKSNYETEYRVRRFDGVYLDFIARGIPVLGEDGEIQEWVGVCIDISERKKTELDLKTISDRLSLATQTGNIGIWDWDIEHNILTWDRSMYLLYGIEEHDFGGAYEAWTSTLHPDDRAYTEGEITAAIQGEREYAPEFRIVRPDGTIRYIKAQSRTIRDESGNAIRMIGTNIDFSDLKKAQEERDFSEAYTVQLEIAKNAAETANRAKSTFLANMSHELRTPLNAILGFSEILENKSNPHSTEHNQLAIIRKSGEHLLSIINAILDLSKIESGRLELTPEPFDLGNLLADLAAMVKVRADAKRISLTLDQSSSFPRFIKADQSKLKQIIVNLVGNAIKFTEHGEIRIKLTTGSFKNGHEHHQIIGEVSDTGIGIAPENIDRILEPFVQAGTHEGTGLGLAITRQLTRLMEGDLSVTSEVGKGSTFRFTIAYEPVDIEDVPAPSVLSGEIESISNAGLFRILIVEDQLENRLLLRTLLENCGFIVREAENGEVGVELAKIWHPHLVFMDRRMPVMDGICATQKIRQLDESEFRPIIIAVTAHAFKEEQQEMRDAGCDDFIAKPYVLATILEQIELHLPLTVIRKSSNNVQPDESFSPTKDSILKISKELRDELLESLIKGKKIEVDAIINIISTQDSQIGIWMQRSTQIYDYGRIISTLEQFDL